MAAKRKIFLLAMMLFQLTVIAGMIAKSMLPLVNGREVQLRVLARDPRDIFRGNYVTLSYDFSDLNLDSIPNDLEPSHGYRFGDEIFIELEPDGENFKTAGIRTKQPSGGIFLRGMIKMHYNSTVSLGAGIESYFTDLAKAQEVEQHLVRDNAWGEVVARIMIAPGGEARIRSLDYIPRRADGIR